MNDPISEWQRRMDEATRQHQRNLRRIRRGERAMLILIVVLFSACAFGPLIVALLRR